MTNKDVRKKSQLQYNNTSPVTKKMVGTPTSSCLHFSSTTALNDKISLF